MENELKDLLPEIWWERYKETKREFIKLKISDRGSLDLAASKAGGVGYLPVDQDYPRNRDTGVPLFLLAQINFEELPKLDGFPQKGILSFYVDYTDDLMGLDFSDQTNQIGFRVLYFEDCSKGSYTREQQLAILVEAEEAGELYKVVSGEFKMEGTKESQYQCGDNFDFENKFGKDLFDWLADVAENEEQKEKIYNKLTKRASGSKIGGYSYFTQQDPRTDDTYDVLLFQLDSESKNGSWPIIWGDVGIGNFFINYQELKEKNFSNVLYNWDCS
ncbi:DUF1963 domain-containing protein [Enterococcus sp. BWT-B8]|uniref:YwqG family protein n=1 Tax=Enterococcus sp. BWT-B8 TaxID=2885157 RepID=UPI001E64E1B4|nr:YwqG family protein [Enterococcus sp. BWT-B8]MCB5950580.1 DUF1963 domain-containing protein [Enterococcus sp. BWT-B8]